MSERRTAWLLTLLLVAQIALLDAQVPEPARGETLLERGILWLVAPAARAVAAVVDVPQGVAASLRTRSALLEENRELRRRADALKLDLLRLRNAEGDVERLRAALAYTPPAETGLRVADIVYADYSSRLRSLVVYVGDRGARVDQPVVAAGGLVGRVIRLSGDYAKVQLLTDPAASAGAMIERSRRQGLIRGGRDPNQLDLDLVPLQEVVRPGDRVVTSGIDGVYPRGIPIGEVTTVEGGDELFHRLRVRPAVEFGVLDQVYLLELPPLPPDLMEGGGDASP